MIARFTSTGTHVGSDGDERHCLASLDLLVRRVWTQSYTHITTIAVDASSAIQWHAAYLAATGPQPDSTQPEPPSSNLNMVGIIHAQPLSRRITCLPQAAPTSFELVHRVHTRDHNATEPGVLRYGRDEFNFQEKIRQSVVCLEVCFLARDPAPRLAHQVVRTWHSCCWPTGSANMNDRNLSDRQ